MNVSSGSFLARDPFVWRILLVDDDEDDYVLVRQMLSESSEGRYTLEWKSNFQDGLKALAADRGFDAVLVDYEMGLHKGIEIIREMVSSEYPAPVLLLTGRGTFDIDVEAMEAGAADYLSKGEMNAVFLQRAIRYAIERKKNELALRESKQRYQDLFRTMLNGFALHEMVYDESGNPVDYRFLEVNPAFEQMTGLAAADIIGKTVREVIPTIEPEWIETYARVTRTGEPVQFENYVGNLDRHFQVYAFRPRENQFATVFSDVTGRVKTESALRESEQRFRAIFENRHSVMLLIDPDTARIVDANTAACAFYGYDKQELVGMKITQINTLPEDQTRGLIQQAQMSESSVNFQFLHRLANGEMRDVEVRSGPVQIGQKRLLFSIVNDVTAHRKTQQELFEKDRRLVEASQHLQLALQAANLGVWSVDLSGEDLQGDEAAHRMHGLEPGDGPFDRMAANRYMHPDDLEKNNRVFEAAVKGDGIFEMEYRILHPAAGLRWIYSFGGFNASRTRLHGVVMDITHLKQTETALRESEAREHKRAAELEALMDAVPAMIWITRDPSCETMFANRYGYEFLNASSGDNISKSAPAEIVARQPYRNFRGGKEIPADEMPMQVAARTGVPAHGYEFDVVFDNGTVANLYGNVEPLFDQDGNPNGSVAAFVDLTDRKRMEQTLQDALFQAAWMARFPEENPSPVMRVTYDGQVLYCNAAGKRAFPEDFTVGRKVSGRLLPMIQRAIEKGSELREDVAFDDRLFGFSMMPYPKEKYVNLYARDETARGRAEQELRAQSEALRQSEARFRAALGALPMTMFTLDANLCYTWIYNPSPDLLPAHVLGKRQDDLLAPGPMESMDEALRWVANEKQKLQRELYVPVDGDWRYYILTLEPLLDENGELVTITGSALDVTAQRRIEARDREFATKLEVHHRLLEQREMERQQISRILHDGPLQGLIGLMYGMQFVEDLSKDSEISSNLDRLGEEAKQLVGELRNLCFELRPPALTRFGLSKSIQSYAADVEKIYPIKIQFNLREPICSLPDSVNLALYRIFQEGLRNILLHAHADRVEIDLYEKDGRLVLKIQDNGSGFMVPPDWVEFARQDRFGFVSMNERAEAVGGTFKVTSTKDQGTVLNVTVPCPPSNGGGNAAEQ